MKFQVVRYGTNITFGGATVSRAVVTLRMAHFHLSLARRDGQDILASGCPAVCHAVRLAVSAIGVTMAYRESWRM